MRVIPHPTPLLLQTVGVALVLVGLFIAAAVLVVPVRSRAPQPGSDCGTTVTALRRHASVLDLTNDDPSDADFENGCHDAARQRLAVGGSVALVLVVAGVMTVRSTLDDS